MDGRSTPFICLKVRAGPTIYPLPSFSCHARNNTIHIPLLHFKASPSFSLYKCMFVRENLQLVTISTTSPYINLTLFLFFIRGHRTSLLVRSIWVIGEVGHIILWWILPSLTTLLIISLKLLPIMLPIQPYESNIYVPLS